MYEWCVVFSCHAQAILGLLAAKQLSGIVVNIGFQLTSVVPGYITTLIYSFFPKR